MLRFVGARRDPDNEVYTLTGPTPVETPVLPPPTCTRAARGPMLVRTPRLDARIRTPGATFTENPTTVPPPNHAHLPQTPCDELCVLTIARKHQVVTSSQVSA
ncbi:hypothetical protein GCM10009742_54730 [Kribbella karoonensis]|uniref:Uncharacterized protein n=1 Tax=Kribbella karoonensis TaxID=324851 RepID=A0ABP4Q512_9ACTN